MIYIDKVIFESYNYLWLLIRDRGSMDVIRKNWLEV